MVNNIGLPASNWNKTFSYNGSGLLKRVKPGNSGQTGDEKNAFIDITAEASGNYIWRGKSLTPLQLESELFEAIKINSISTARLLKGEAELSTERCLEFGKIIHAIDAKAFYEYDGEFKAITFGPGM